MVSLPPSLVQPQPPALLGIVGIGASAGGLDALEKFFARVPVRSGLAYIVVQHLDPTQKAMLAELLQRVTSLVVREAGEAMRVEANHIYVIPPNAELSLMQGVLHVVLPTEPRGMRLPVNVLFSSLAREQGASGIGIVLSGMGSDGTLGLQALKAVGGLTIVQEPSSAQFDAMPQSAIAAGCADIVALPADMPARILACIAWDGRSKSPITDWAADGAPTDEPLDPPVDTIESIFSLLRKRTRHDFSLYKPSTLNRRIEIGRASCRERV